ncbi:hypothetical protein JRQ81_000703 [Phrynocephalus forsythii]|uniref:Uncharacterized protein n=1 Tax=Phrynocephalus forsythii TaxID=171643 RepID=A0A9Q0Y6M5_9SAUR|nr:hypothetical protein JRQ81_000703 [Phrynocephalus forsythii]
MAIMRPKPKSTAQFQSSLSLEFSSQSPLINADKWNAPPAATAAQQQQQQQQLANSAAIRAEIQRFESVHPNIYSIYELLERVEEPALQNQIREHVIAIEDSSIFCSL